MKRLKRKSKSTADVIQRLMAVHCRVCAICGRPSTHCGVFVPKNQEAYGATPGETRTFPYGLCEEHSNDPRTPGQVETMIEKELATAFLLKGAYVDSEGNVKAALYGRGAQLGMN